MSVGFEAGLLAALGVVREYEAKMAAAAKRPHPLHTRGNIVALCKEDAAQSIGERLEAILAEARADAEGPNDVEDACP